MSEEIKAVSEKKSGQIFLAPNCINLAAAVLLCAVVVMMAFMPVFHISGSGDALSGYNGENDITYSGYDVIMDMIKEFDIEKDPGAFVTPAGAGNFSKAVTLLAYQETFDYAQALKEYEAQKLAGNEEAKRPAEPQLSSRVFYAIAVAIPALLPIITCLIMALISLIGAIKRFFTCKPYPKFKDNFMILLGPALMVGLVLLFRTFGNCYQYMHFVESTILTMLVLCGIILVLDTLCFAMAKSLSGKHYPHQS